MTTECIRTFGRNFWTTFSDMFRSVVRVIEIVLPTEVAWAIIYLFLWMGVVCLVMWLGT